MKYKLSDWDKDRALKALGIKEEPFGFTPNGFSEARAQKYKAEGTMGYADMELRKLARAPEAMDSFRILWHEIAHIVLNHKPGQHLQQELEADGAAHILVKYFKAPMSAGEHKTCREYRKMLLQNDPLPFHFMYRLHFYLTAARRAAETILLAGLRPEVIP